MYKTCIVILIMLLAACSENTIAIDIQHLEVVNRDPVVLEDKPVYTALFNRKPDVGLAILKNQKFNKGSIELELKGENNPGKSFVGFAFNIENDSTYEAIYFRPFNFKADTKTKRSHSVQYINEPKHSWFYLRENFKGDYEAEYPNPPSPDDWFTVTIKIDYTTISVYDKNSNTQLLHVKRLKKQVSNKIALWMGNNSKGGFRKLKILK